jgi:hypothetical protein
MKPTIKTLYSKTIGDYYVAIKETPKNPAAGAGIG